MSRETGGQLVQLQPTSQTLIGKYRRNRKLQSCEPCRKSKLACDHSVPCGRCVRKRCVESCYYHPNPLTRNPKSNINPKIGPASRPDQTGASDDSRCALRSIEPHPTGRAKVPIVPQRPRYWAGPVPHRASSAPLPDERREDEPVRSGFLGFVSYSSFITEDLEDLGVKSVDLQAAPFQDPAITSNKLAQNYQILAFLQNKPFIDQCMNLLFTSVEGVYVLAGKPIMQEWISQLWHFHGDTLQSQNPARIRQLCQLLCRNTQAPLEISGHTTPLQWIRSATGVSIRWEVIGMIATYVGLAAMHADASNPILVDNNLERKTLIVQMYELAEACLNICREYDALDDLFVWLLHETQNLIECIKGEASYATYRMSSEASSALIAMGLHQEIKADDRVPFFLAEFRKRLRAIVYMEEIGMAAFLGRPPRISYRHWNLEPPLDLTESQILSEGKPELTAAIESLDEKGYNRTGHIRHITWIRSWVVLATRREDILNLALGDYSREEIRRRAEIIERKTEEHFAALPEFIASLRDGNFEIDSTRPLDSLFRNIFCQAGLSNNLLLQRVLMRKADVSSEGLVRAAQTIVRVVMRIIRRTELVPSYSPQITGMLALHGLRSAATLAIELLKQEQLLTYPKEPLLPRAQTIEDLTVFTTYLNGVNPLLGSANLCLQGKKVITRVLDKILSSSDTAARCPPDAPPQRLDTNDFTDEMTANARISDGFLTTDDFILDIDAPLFGADHDFRLWLESMEWQQ